MFLLSISIAIKIIVTTPRGKRKQQQQLMKSNLKLFGVDGNVRNSVGSNFPFCIISLFLLSRVLLLWL
jgi:hypothetical protein